MASLLVSKSPSITPIFILSFKASIVASNKDVLPEPGELIRFIQNTPCSSKCFLFECACLSFGS
jgi:hypothetical protein